MPNINTTTAANTPANRFGNLDEEFLAALVAHTLGWHTNTPYAGTVDDTEVLSISSAGVTSFNDAALYGNYTAGQLKKILIQVQGESGAPGTDLLKFRTDRTSANAEVTSEGGFICSHLDQIWLLQPHEWESFACQALTSGVQLVISYITIETDL